MNGLYPTRGGLPVPIEELGLKKSELDPTDPRNFSRHHLFYPASRYMNSLVFRTLRDLDTSQVVMPNDQHNLGRFCLHMLYKTLEKPSLKTAMDELSRRKEEGTMLVVQRDYGYVRRGFSNNLWWQIKKEYDRRPK